MHNYLDYSFRSWSKITHCHLKAFLSCFLGYLFKIEKNENVIDLFFRTDSVELMFCKHQDVGFLHLGDQLMNFLLWIFYWFSSELWIFGSFLKTNLTLVWSFSSVFFFCLLSSPLPAQCSGNMSHTLHIILKIYSDLYTSPSSKSRNAKSIMNFLWVWLLSKCLRSVQLVRRQLLFSLCFRE